MRVLSRFLPILLAGTAIVLPLQANLLIVPDFELSSNVPTSCPTLQTLCVANVENAVNYVISQYEADFTNPITINITITDGTSTTDLGESDSFLYTDNNHLTYAALKAALTSHATDTTDATVLANLPATDPAPAGNHTYALTDAQAQALGFLPSDNFGNSDGTFTFSDEFNYTFDPNNRAIPGDYDFIGVAEHEISEIMGRIGLLGANTSGPPEYSLLDLLSYSAPGALDMTSSNQGSGDDYFSIDGGVTDLRNFNNQNINGGDSRDWAGQTNNSYNAFSSSSVENGVDSIDLEEMDAIGYTLAAPEPGTFALAFGALLGCAGFRRMRRHAASGS